MTIQKWLHQHVKYTASGTFNKHGALKSFKFIVNESNWDAAFSSQNYGQIKKNLSEIQQKLIAFIECELRKLPLHDKSGQIFDITEQLDDAQKNALSYLHENNGDYATLRVCIAQELETADQNYKFLLHRILHRITKEINAATDDSDNSSTFYANHVETASHRSSDSNESMELNLPDAPQLDFKAKSLAINDSLLSLKTKEYVDAGWFVDSVYTLWQPLENLTHYVKYTFYAWFTSLFTSLVYSGSNQFFMNHFADESTDLRSSDDKKQAVKDMFHQYKAHANLLKNAVDAVNGNTKEQELVDKVSALTQLHQQVMQKKEAVIQAIKTSQEGIWIDYFNEDLLAFYAELQEKLLTHYKTLTTEIETKVQHLINARPDLNWTVVLQQFPEVTDSSKIDVQTTMDIDLNSDKIAEAVLPVQPSLSFDNAKKLEKIIAGDVYALLPNDLEPYEIEGLTRLLEQRVLTVPEQDNETEQNKRADALIRLARNNLIYGRLAVRASQLKELSKVDFLQTIERAAEKISKRGNIATQLSDYISEQDLMLNRLVTLTKQLNDAKSEGFAIAIGEFKEKVKKKFKHMPAFMEKMHRRINDISSQQGMPHIIAFAIEYWVISNYVNANQYTSFEALKKLYSNKTWWPAFEFVHQQLNKVLTANKQSADFENEDETDFDIEHVIIQIEAFYLTHANLTAVPKVEVYRSLKQALKILMDDYPEVEKYYKAVRTKFKFLEAQQGVNIDGKPLQNQYNLLHKKPDSANHNPYANYNSKSSFTAF